jgi:hypothetical protein
MALTAPWAAVSDASYQAEQGAGSWYLYETLGDARAGRDHEKTCSL